MTTASFDTTTVFNAILAQVSAMPMNSDKANGVVGLRQLASFKGIAGIKGKGKAELAADVATVMTNEAKEIFERDQAAKAAQEAQEASAKQDTAAKRLHSQRNHNATIRPRDTAVVDAVWALLTREGGASTNEVIAAVIAATPCQPGAVVSRMSTQRKNGNMVSSTVKDAMNRDIAMWSAAPSWTKADMAKSFLKVTAATV